MTKFLLKQLLTELNIQVILLDACGVLYDGESIFPLIPETISKLKQLGYPIRLVTNNSSLPPKEIADRFLHFGIEVYEEEIISSGFGLYLDPFIHKLIQNKKIYVFGRKNSFYYVNKARPKEIMQNIDQADVIVFTDTLPSEEINSITEKILTAFKHRKIPMVCCNPDRVIYKNGQLIPVIGYYVDQIIKKTGASVYWFGKPYKNFSCMTEKILKKQNLLNNRSKVCFFDDNLRNVLRLSKDLQINGCLIKNTGLAKTSIFDKLIARKIIRIPLVIDQFTY